MHLWKFLFTDRYKTQFSSLLTYRISIYNIYLLVHWWTNTQSLVYSSLINPAEHRHPTLHSHFLGHKSPLLLNNRKLTHDGGHFHPHRENSSFFRKHAEDWNTSAILIKCNKNKKLANILKNITWYSSVFVVQYYFIF